jgi:hypothetical protein
MILEFQGLKPTCRRKSSSDRAAQQRCAPAMAVEIERKFLVADHGWQTM